MDINKESVALSLEDESPAAPSYLLCTSQWSALLESTSASLALKREKNYPSTTRDEPKTIEERIHGVATFERASSRSPEMAGHCVTGSSVSGDENSTTPLGQSSPESGMSQCQSEEYLSQLHHHQQQYQQQREVQIFEVLLPVDSTNSDQIVLYPQTTEHEITQDPNIPQLLPPANVIEPSCRLQPPAPPPSSNTVPQLQVSLATPSTMMVPHKEALSNSSAHVCIHGNTSSSTHVSMHHTVGGYTDVISQQHSSDLEHLSIPLEADEDNLLAEGHEGEFQQHSNTGSVSQRSSMASSTANVTLEWEASPLCRRDLFRTHSRNVSETPSVPPFYSSSTSSAYHSRNSSLGSQMSSSCFESDSMLSQLTDLDTGCHGDMKHPIRLQDSRYSRLGDSSPVSYSSDLSLHHHMNQPIGMHDSLLGLSPVNLEDTLKNLPMENIDERKKMASMKSSEWIKRQFDRHRESLVQVKVSSKTKHVVHFNVKAGDVIIWEFATKKKDIAFGVLFEATEVATEASPLPDSHESLEKKVSSILPIFRVNSQGHPTVGTHTAVQDGVYEIIWDNSYSRFFAKDLYYRITTQPSVPNDNYLQQ